MQLYFRLAWRNIWRHRRRTVIIVLAMALTLALMMFYDGLMNGFTDVIYGNAVKVLGGNIQVHAQGYRQQASSTPLWQPPGVSTPVGWSPTAQAPLRSASRGLSLSANCR